MKAMRALLTVVWLGAIPADAADDDFAVRILAAHNAERSALDLPPLVWDDALAADAAVWAKHLAGTGSFQHALYTDRRGMGENLWEGKAGDYSLEDMVAGWARQKRYFRYGRFPDVSATGRWYDVADYTRMIWKNTSSVGCAMAEGRGTYVLVCRYDPPGNMLGEWPY